MKEETCPYAFLSLTCSENCRDLFFLKYNSFSVSSLPSSTKALIFIWEPAPTPMYFTWGPSHPWDLWVLATPVTMCHPSGRRDCFRINAKSKTNGDPWNMVTRLWFNLSGKLDMKERGYRVRSCWRLGMEGTGSYSVDLADPQARLHQSV